MKTNRCIVLTGCSGGGKSALIQELRKRGWKAVDEAGRQIVRLQLENDGDALPWTNPQLFVEQAANLSLQQIVSALIHTERIPIFTDRCIVDVISYLDFCSLQTPSRLLRLMSENQYATTVYVTPPWEELFVCDNERPKTFEEAVREHLHTVITYEHLGYSLVEVPKISIPGRASFIENYMNFIP